MIRFSIRNIVGELLSPLSVAGSQIYVVSTVIGPKTRLGNKLWRACFFVSFMIQERSENTNGNIFRMSILQTIRVREFRRRFDSMTYLSQDLSISASGNSQLKVSPSSEMLTMENNKILMYHNRVDQSRVFIEFHIFTCEFWLNEIFD